MRNGQSIQHAIMQKYPMFGIQPAKSHNIQTRGIKPPSWITEGPLYEVYVRSFSENGSFTGVEKRLSELKELGIKTIWLMPIHPIGHIGRKGNLGCPYAIMDHMAVNPEYGTLNDFQYLVDAIHDHDMCIILDMVINHSARDHILYPDNSQMFNTTFKHSPEDWTDVREFNYDSKLTRKYATDVLTFWVKNYGIDGYRCDVAGLVPLDFWDEVVEQLLDINPDLYMLAEWQSSNMHNKAFHSTYDWVLYLILKEVAAGNRPASDIILWQQEQKRCYPANAAPLRFTENHDMSRTMTTFGRDQFLPYATYVFLSEGIPLLYNGQEIGSDSELSLFDKSIMNWNNYNGQVREFYKKLIQIRYTNRSMFESGLINIVNDQPEKVVTFLKENDENKLLIILNFSKEELSVNIDFPDFIADKTFMELMTDTKLKSENGRTNLRANQVMVLKSQ